MSTSVTGPATYLAICAIYLDEGPYLREWIEFHRLVGAERFFLYDHGSADEHREVLAPYVEAGIVVVHDWPGKGQVGAYDDCLERHRHDSRWIAFLDLDEFLFSPTGQPVSALLPEYEQWAAVCVNWAVYGSSGHDRKPPGLVIENYLHRTTSARKNGHMKSIVDPTRTERCTGPHSFVYRDGSAVDEEKQVTLGTRRDRITFSRLRINHYWTKSKEEARRKLLRVRADTGEWRPRAAANLPRSDLMLNELRDDAITIYAPALREVLARDPRSIGETSALDLSEDVGGRDPLADPA